MLAHLASTMQLDIIMLQEVSIIVKEGLQHEDLGAGWSLYYSSADSRGRGGVGALIGPRLQRNICCVNLSPRLLRVDVRLRGRNARLFSAYAPTAAHQQEAQEFFEFLSEQIEGVAQRDTLVVLGDFNAVAERTSRTPFVSARQNANTTAFVDLMSRQDLVSANTRFRKPAFRLATFVGCKRKKRNARRNATTRRAQLDHILVRFRERSRVTDCDTMTPLSIRSDHRLLFCELRLRDPLYRPPRRPPRRYYRALRDPGTRSRFAYAFAAALGQSASNTYADVSAAITAAAAKTLPLMQPAARNLPAWASDKEVQEARRTVERLRRIRQPTSDAEKSLAEIYARRQQAAVNDAIRSVNSAGIDQRNRLVWPTINALTGRKKKTALNLAGDTAEARCNELRDFFAGIVNAPPPILPDELPLPTDTALPSQVDFDTQPVTSSDVVQLARKAPGGRALGPDEVPVEALRITRVAAEVARVMNGVLAGGVAPIEWTTAHIVAIPKKPGTTRKEEHRGISLMSCAAKLFNRVLLARLQPVLDPFLRYEQNGFRPARGTVTQILALRRTIEEARIHQSSLVVVFVDFRKAFDSVARDALPLVLRAYNVPQQLVSAVMAMYQNTTAAVMTPDGLSDLFNTSSGVLQGDTLAPFLFVLALDWVLRIGLPDSDNGDGFMLRRRMSRRHPEKRLCALAYADDIALLSSTAEGAQRLLNGLTIAASRIGLVLNGQKTEVFTVPLDLPAEIKYRNADGEEALLPRCQHFVYLGGLVPDVSSDLRRRRGLAWAALRSVRSVLLSEALEDETRAQLFRAVVETVLLYNAETWTLTDALEKQLDSAHAAMLRAAFGVRCGPGSETNVALYARTRLSRPSDLLRARRLRLTGHVIRSENRCREPLHELLLLELQGPRRRGQGRTARYPELLMNDTRCLTLTRRGWGADTLRDLAVRRAI